jgi:hypothetical protein
MADSPHGHGPWFICGTPFVELNFQDFLGRLAALNRGYGDPLAQRLALALITCALIFADPSW